MFVGAQPVGAALELRRDDQDPPHDRDQADVEEGLDRDLVRAHDEAQRVEELADDQCQQDALDRTFRQVGSRRARDRRSGDALRRTVGRELAPKTVAAFKASLPLDDRIIHCRWSGESNWIPWGDRDFGIGPENATSYPHPGELALYPGGQSETELLFPYGYCSFASKAGHLWANHFATLVEGAEQLPELGRLTLWEGAQQITFREL